MRLIGQEVDALAEHQLNEFAGERLLTGLALKCRSRPFLVAQRASNTTKWSKHWPVRPSSDEWANESFMCRSASHLQNQKITTRSNERSIPP